MHKEAQQAASGLTSLGAISEEGAHPQLSSYSTAEADPGNSTPNDFIPSQQDQTKSARDRLKTPHTNLGTNEESRADENSKKIKLGELSDLLKDIRFAFFTPESPQDEPIIVSDESEEEEEVDKDKDTHATSHDELPTDFQALPRQVSSVQEKLKTLDSLPSVLTKVTDTLNRFAPMVEHALGAASNNVPSSGQASASPAKGEKNTKDAETNLQNKLLNLLGIDMMKQYHNKKLLFDKYCDKMLKRRKGSKIINCDVLAQKGHISLKVYREYGTIEFIKIFKVSDLHLAE
nr:hypothetical protein [Tanacetum cinerariifolium]